MPFVTTLSEESLKKDVTTLKITTNGTIIQVDKAFLQKIVEADTEEKIAENEEKILNLALENQKTEEEKENKEEAKLVALKNKLSSEKNKLEQERKDLDSIIQKLLETKKYKLSLENASENLKKISSH